MLPNKKNKNAFIPVVHGPLQRVLTVHMQEPGLLTGLQDLCWYDSPLVMCCVCLLCLTACWLWFMFLENCCWKDWRWPRTLTCQRLTSPFCSRQMWIKGPSGWNTTRKQKLQLSDCNRNLEGSVKNLDTLPWQQQTPKMTELQMKVAAFLPFYSFVLAALFLSASMQLCETENKHICYSSKRWETVLQLCRWHM